MISLYWNEELEKVDPRDRSLFKSIPNAIIFVLEKFGISVDIDKFSIDSGRAIGQYYTGKRTTDKLTLNDKIFIRYASGDLSFIVTIFKKGKICISPENSYLTKSMTSYLNLERIASKSFCNNMNIFIYHEENYAIRDIEIMMRFHYKPQTDPYNRKENLVFSHEFNFFFNKNTELQKVNKIDNLKFLDYNRHEQEYILNGSYDLSLSEILWIAENEAISIRNDEARKLIPEALYPGVYLFDGDSYYRRYCMADILTS